jgi:hypothetical protein
MVDKELAEEAAKTEGETLAAAAGCAAVDHTNTTQHNTTQNSTRQIHTYNAAHTHTHTHTLTHTHT